MYFFCCRVRSKRPPSSKHLLRSFQLSRISQSTITKYIKFDETICKANEKDSNNNLFVDLYGVEVVD